MGDAILDAIRFCWLCIKDAGRGSWGSANAWATLLGAVVLWIGSEMLGYHLMLPGSFPEGIFLALACTGAAWIVFFVVRLLGTPSKLYWIEQRKNDVSTSFLTGDNIYTESKWVKWKDSAETGLYEAGFYLTIGNALNNGKTLERVQARIFFMGEPLLARVKETGSTEIDIRHGEWAYFQIGSLVSKQMHGLIYNGVEINEERRKNYEINIPLNVLSFEVWEPSGKRAYGLGHSPTNPGKFTLIIIVSANDVIAKHIPITVDLSNNDPVSYSS